MPVGLQPSPQGAWSGVKTGFVGRAVFSQQRQSCSILHQASCIAARSHTTKPGTAFSCTRSLRGTPLTQQAVPFKRITCLPPAASAADNAAPAEGQPVDHTPKTTVLKAASKFSPANVLRQGQGGLQIVQHSWQLLKAHIWPILLIYAMVDATQWMGARLSNRLTNEVAIRLLNLRPEAVASSLWFLSPNPQFASPLSGYRIIMYIAIAAGLPLSLLTRSVGSAAVALLCCRHPNPAAPETSVQDTAASQESTPSNADAAQNTDSSVQPAESTAKPASTAKPGSTAKPESTAKQGPKGIRATFHHVVSTVRLLQPGVAAVWKQVFIMELLVAFQVVPLQLISLLVLPLPWTLPRLLDLQACNPVVALEGLQGRQAIIRARELVKPLKGAVAFPFLGLILMTNIVPLVKGEVLAGMPVRWYKDLPEIPIVAFVGFSLLTLVIQRLHNLLPIVIYQQGQQHDAQPDPKPV